MRRMPNGDSIVNLGDLVEMESQGHLILKVAGEINQLGIGDVRTCGRREWRSKKSELIG